MTTSIWLDRPQKSSIKKDFVIVGAGLSGLSIAYWLRKSFPDSTIGIIEKNRLGYGASGRNAGVLSAGSITHLQNLISIFGQEKAMRIWHFAESNNSLLEEHLNLTQDPSIGYFKNGSLSVADTAEQYESLVDFANTLSSKGVRFEEVKKQDLSNLYSLSGFEGAVFCQDDGCLNPMGLMEKLYVLSKADLFDGVEALGFAESATGKVAIRTDRGLFECSRLFIATNSNLTQMLPSFSERISPVRGQALVSEPTALRLCPVVYSSRDKCSIRQLESGCLLVSGFKKELDPHCSTTEDITTVEVQSHLETFMQKHLPWANPNIQYRWSGIIGLTKSHQPIVGTAPGNKSVFVSVGFSGYGNSIAFLAAQSLVHHLEGKPIPDIYEAPS